MCVNQTVTAALAKCSICAGSVIKILDSLRSRPLDVITIRHRAHRARMLIALALRLNELCVLVVLLCALRCVLHPQCRPCAAMDGSTRHL